MTTYFVKPKEPTVFGHKEYHQMSSTNLKLSAVVPSVYVIPEIMDIEKFNVALSNALSYFPHVAGRLVRPDTRATPWAIRLTNSGLPVKLADSDAEEIMPTDLSAQPSLPLAEPLNVVGIINTEGESDEPLFRLTVTRFPKLNSTAIGWCMSHGLFDASGAIMFYETISRFYQGLGPIDSPLWYEQEALEFPETNTQFTVLHRFDPSGPAPWDRPDRKAMDFVAFRLTSAQLSEIHATTTKGCGKLRVSRADLLAGLLVRCFSEIESKPINTIWNVINHRGMGIYPLNAVVNAVFFLPTRLQDLRATDIRDGILSCVAEIRKSLEDLKSPEFIKDMVAGAAKVEFDVAWDKMGQDLQESMDGCMTLNSLWKLGWTRPHFGHPGKVKFYHGHPPGARYAKVVATNPICVDGKWINREEDLEVTFYVPPGKRKRVEELFEGYAKCLGMTGSVEFLAQPQTIRSRL